MYQSLQKGSETVPGIGQAGTMLCPLMKQPCWKSACMLWVELTYAKDTPEERKVGNCALTWSPIITSEQTQAIGRLTKTIESFGSPVKAPAGKAPNRNGKKNATQR